MTSLQINWIKSFFCFSSLLAYIGFMAYGTLFPFGGWNIPQESIPDILLYGWFDKVFLFDIVQNLLLYIPFGFFLALCLGEMNFIANVFLCMCATVMVSTTFEWLQAFNPIRVPSLLDISLNVISGMLGCILAFFFTMLARAKTWVNFVESTFKPTHPYPFLKWIGVLLVLGWGVYQLSPFVPTLHPRRLTYGLSLLLDFFKGEHYFIWWRFCYYCAQGAGLYLLGFLFLNPKRQLWVLLCFALFILSLKIIVITRVLSPEALFGILAGMILFALLEKLTTGEEST